MELREAVAGRRSVRKFKPDPVSREVILDVLQKANMAPSAGNRQPWEFIVLGKKDLQEILEITKIAFKERFGSMEQPQLDNMLSRLSLPDEDRYTGLRRFYSTLGDAPVVIIVCSERGKDDFASLMNYSGTAAAVQTLLLAAWEHGLGTCWMMGPLQKKGRQLKELLSISPDKEIVAIIPLGIPEVIPEKPPKEAVETKIRWDKQSK